MNIDELKTYEGHQIGLEWLTHGDPASGFAWTDWILWIDDHQFYLGQDAKFVARVLGDDFAAFIHAAFDRVGLKGGELVDKDHDLLKASLAVGVVEGLCERWEQDGSDFLAAVPELEPWSLSTS